MILELGGITTEVTNPSEIALFKRRGWVEIKDAKGESLTEAPSEPSKEKTVSDDKSKKH